MTDFVRNDNFGPAFAALATSPVAENPTTRTVTLGDPMVSERLIGQDLLYYDASGEVYPAKVVGVNATKGKVSAAIFGPTYLFLRGLRVTMFPTVGQLYDPGR